LKMPIMGAYCVTITGTCINRKMPGKCATCVEVCPHGVFDITEDGTVNIKNDLACVGCRICVEHCPYDAIHIRPAESEYRSRGLWTFQTIEEIHHKAESGEYILRGFGTMGPTPHFDSMVIVPSQLASPPPRDKYREECNMEVVIGGDKVDKPMRLGMPILFAGMSYGAISLEAKKALAIGAAKARTATNTGEGGAIPNEFLIAHGYENEKAMKVGKQKWKPGGYLIAQWSTGRWGVSLDYLRKSDAVEIKIGQGAKPGMGGHLLGKKVTEDIARVRGLPVGSDALSPCRYYDVLDVKDLKKQVDILRDITDYKVPILMKIGPSRPYNDTYLAAEAGVDAISVDGMVGGTGCSPEAVTQGTGIPTIACIPSAVRALKDLRLHKKIKLIALGGIRNGLDVVKALALGADAVGIGAAAEIAMGCRACMACHKGTCAYGVATQDPKLRERLKPELAGQRLANFLHATAEEIKILTMLSGHDDIRQLSKEDLRALDINTAAMTGIKLAGFDNYFPKDWKKFE
jgi:glutamate synthase domain-containing protein 2